MQKGYTQWVKSPKTNRLVKVGGPTWRKLVKEGMLDGLIKHPVVNPKTGITQNTLESAEEIIETIEPNNPQSEFSEAIEQEPETEKILPNNKAGGNPPSQKGKRQIRLKQQEVTQLSTKAAIEIIQQNAESLANELEDIAYIEDEDEYNQRMTKFEKNVEQMIYQQLLSKKETPRLKKEIEYETDYSIINEVN